MESEGEVPESGLGLRVWRRRDDWFNHIRLNLFSYYNLRVWNFQGSGQGCVGGGGVGEEEILCG